MGTVLVALGMKKVESLGFCSLLREAQESDEIMRLRK